MSYHKLHQQKKYKNYAMLVILIIIVILFFSVATIRMDNYIAKQPLLTTKNNNE
jgi:hypothetical protein